LLGSAQPLARWEAINNRNTWSAAVAVMNVDRRLIIVIGDDSCNTPSLPE
jgi:hypothetical protein